MRQDEARTGTPRDRSTPRRAGAADSVQVDSMVLIDGKRGSVRTPQAERKGRRSHAAPHPRKEEMVSVSELHRRGMGNDSWVANAPFSEAVLLPARPLWLLYTY